MSGGSEGSEVGSGAAGSADAERLLSDIDRLKALMAERGDGPEPDLMRLLLARVTADHCFQFIGLTDGNGINWESNQASLDAAGISRPQGQGIPAAETPWFRNLPDAANVLRALFDRAESGEFVRCDLEHRGEGGEGMVIVDFSLTPVRDRDGQVAFIVAEGRDVTAQRGMEREIQRQRGELEAMTLRLRELDALKSRLFANISHEFRTPLSLVLGPVERMAADAELPQVHRDRLREVASSARLLLRHVNAMLDLARLEAHRLRLSYARCDLAALVRRTSDVFASAGVERGVRLELRVPDELPVECDPERLADVLVNLLSNALKFAPAGGVIRCSAGLDGDTAWFEVADSGPGIPESVRAAIFERFRQVESDAGRPSQGIGLGLAIARELVSLHGGDIEAGQAPEGGALFRVRLPRAAPEDVAVGDACALPDVAGPEPIRQAPGALPEGRIGLGPFDPQRLRPAAVELDEARPDVLVVEDSEDLRRFILDVLGDRRRVVGAGDGASGLALARRLHPLVVVTDMMMPVMSGEELVRALRDDPATRAIPVLLLSARADDEMRLRLLREGARDYVSKPFAVDELVARVDNLLAVQRAREELEEARRAAEQANQAKTDFLAMMSHDIRNPMNAVMAALDLLLDGVLGDEQRRLVTAARSGGESLLGLLADSLDVARIEAGRFELEAAPVDIHQVAEEVTRLMGLRASPGVRVEVDCPPGAAPVVLTDAARLRQVLDNLLSNALKFTARGHVRVEIREEGRDDGHVLLSIAVADSGPGIPEDRLARIFERFIQADPTVRRRHGGSGLGLAIVRGIVQAMGGTVTVTSRVGEGSRFEVRLRLPVASVARRAVHPGDERRHVLLVEDEPVSRTLATALLARLGCTVEAVGTGAEALRQVEAAPFDLVVMDCELPDAEGFQLAAAVRARDPGAPILALTGHDLASRADGLSGAGIDDWLRKPVRLETLGDALARLPHRGSRH